MSVKNIRTLFLAAFAAFLLAPQYAYSLDYEWGCTFAAYQLHGRQLGTGTAVPPSGNVRRVAFKFTARYGGTIDNLTVAVGRGAADGQSIYVGLSSYTANTQAAQTYLSQSAAVGVSGGNSNLPYWASGDVSYEASVDETLYLIVTRNSLSSAGGDASGVIYGAPNPAIYPYDSYTDNNLSVYFAQSNGAALGVLSGYIPSFIIRYNAGTSYQGQPYCRFPTADYETATVPIADGGIMDAADPATDSLDNEIDQAHIYGTRAVGMNFQATASRKNLVNLKLYVQRVGGSAPIDDLYFKVTNEAATQVIIDTTVYLAKGDVTTAFGYQPAAGKTFYGGEFTAGTRYRIFFFSPLTTSASGNYYRLCFMEPSAGGNITTAASVPAGANNLTYEGTDVYAQYTSDYRNKTTFALPRTAPDSYGDITLTVTTDNDPPEMNVSAPDSGEEKYYNQLSNVLGNTLDNYYVHHASGAEITIRVLEGAGADNNKYWKPGTGWDSARWWIQISTPINTVSMDWVYNTAAWISSDKRF